MGARSLPAFDALYRGSSDPWQTETRWYERRKRALVLACLPRERYRSAYEPGCGNGILTEALAARCDKVLASDGSKLAIVAARTRLAAIDNVKVRRQVFPSDWPSQSFDLVILSEVGYFLDAASIEQLGQKARGSLPDHGVVLGCNWRAPIVGYGHSGEEAHRQLGAAIDLPRIFEYSDADFIVSAWSRDTTSIATRESIR